MSRTPAEHLEQARDNLTVAESLLQQHGQDPPFVQWAVVAAFYCAMHCIQAHLVRLGADPRSHGARGRLLADPNSGVPARVQTAYLMLYECSRDARYELATFEPEWVKDRLIGRYLARITAFVGL